MGDSLCVHQKDCQICKAFTHAQLKQFSTPTYQFRKERDQKKMASDFPANVTPTLVDPSEVTLLGRVQRESSADSTPASNKKKADPSPTPKASSKKKFSRQSRSDDIKDLDEKWSERFARLEAMLVSKTFTVPVNPVQNPPSVLTSDQLFFYPGTSTTGWSSGVTVGGTGSSLDQTIGEAAVMREAVNKSATHPVEAPGTDVKQQNATQPFEAPSARTATKPVEAPSAGPEVLLSSAGETVLQSDSDYDLQSEPTSPVDVNDWSGSPDRDFNREDTGGQDLSEDDSYRETIRGVRFMGWHNIPEFDRVSSSDDNPFAGSRVQPTGKVSVKLPVDEWFCRKMEKLNLTITEGYPSRNAETAGLLRDQFIKPPRSSKWYDMHTNKKDSDFSTVCAWSQELAKLSSAFSRVARRSLPVAPPSRTFSQEMLRRWERASREQTIMCNQAAGLSRCLTKVQHVMSYQLKNLHADKSKGKSSERTQQAVEELEYLVTFNRSISQAMARTMQDLSEGVFISMANFTLARRDSYLEYLHAGVKQDTLTALHIAPIHLHSLFPDNLLIKAEEEVSRSEERLSAGQSHMKPGRFHPYASNDKFSHQPDRKLSVPAWKQIRECQQGKKGRGKPSTFAQKPAKGSKPRK